jgi:uncharacterized protein (TIGR00369 family)
MIHYQLHGGATATAVDIATSFALIGFDDKSRPSVSVDLTVSYARSAPIGETVFLFAKVIKIGKNLGKWEFKLK